MTTAATAAALEDSSAAETTSEKRRPRIPVLKLTAVLLGIAALTPFWILYGVVGSVLTTPSAALSRRGIALLVLLAALVVAEFVLVEMRFVEELGAAVTGSPTTRAGMLVQLGTALIALLIAQLKFHRLISVVIDQPTESDSAISMLLDFGAPFLFLLAMWESMMQWKHWQLISGLSIYLFLAVYLTVPVVVTLAHAKFWIPARYSELERIERQILERNVRSTFHLLKVAGLGTVFVPTTSSKGKAGTKTLVLIHGFAAGNALWACNLDFLAQHYDVYAIEWVGQGRSDRPDFTTYEQEEADRIFVDAIEKWRIAMKLEKFYLGGHSMGAMFASSYAVRYPSHVEHLVLISPAGVGHPPPPRPLPFAIKIFRFLWNLRLTPMSLARFAGPFGPALLRLIASTRIRFMPETNCFRSGRIPVDSIAAYWYHNWALKASGEIAMHSHLLPGVFAKKPLCTILTPDKISIPITFMYGGGPDWMDSSHGEEVASKFAGRQRVQVLKVPHAGHQVFTDNIDDFNSMLVDVLTPKET
ncbi:hypothetical protein PINS_up008715 [Pythium insidiosum]|nr:hypothetical protein PINS_up008715 [Pythium insidiosum]